MSRRALFLAMPVAAAIVGACSHFDSAPASVDAGVEASVDATPVVTDAGTTVVDADAALPCLSQHFEDGGGCDPIVFVTPDSYRGDLGGDGGVARADAICAELGAPYNFKAWLSQNGFATAGVRFTEIGAGASRGVYLIDGTNVADSYNAMLEQKQLTHAIDRTLKGGLVADDEEVWTGTDVDGKFINDCKGWSSNQGPDMGTAGRAGSADYAWTAFHPSINCDQQKHLYCFEIVP
jgi:hypothetical protein